LIYVVVVVVNGRYSAAPYSSPDWSALCVLESFENMSVFGAVITSTSGLAFYWATLYCVSLSYVGVLIQWLRLQVNVW